MTLIDKILTLLAVLEDTPGIDYTSKSTGETFRYTLEEARGLVRAMKYNQEDQR